MRERLAELIKFTVLLIPARTDTRRIHDSMYKNPISSCRVDVGLKLKPWSVMSSTLGATAGHSAKRT